MTESRDLHPLLQGIFQKQVLMRARAVLQHPHPVRLTLTMNLRKGKFASYLVPEARSCRFLRLWVLRDLVSTQICDVFRLWVLIDMTTAMPKKKPRKIIIICPETTRLGITKWSGRYSLQWWEKHGGLNYFEVVSERAGAKRENSNIPFWLASYSLFLVLQSVFFLKVKWTHSSIGVRCQEFVSSLARYALKW